MKQRHSIQQENILCDHDWYVDYTYIEIPEYDDEHVHEGQLESRRAIRGRRLLGTLGTQLFFM